MNYKQGLFTLTVKEGTTITPSAIREAVPQRFKVPLVEVIGLEGQVQRSSASASLAATGQKTPYALHEKRNGQLVAKLEDGQTVTVSGKLTEKTVDQKSELVIEVKSVQAKQKTS